MAHGLNVLYTGYSELREIPARQVPGEPTRRWFMSANCDLIVWIGADETLQGFQFCYDKDEREHALMWTRRYGYNHMEVDSGENPPTFGGAPCLLPGEALDPRRVLDIFVAESGSVPEAYVSLVTERIELLLQR